MKFRKFRFAYVIILITFIFQTQQLFSQFPDDVIVTRITRISHPAYQAGNEWYSVRKPWNRNFTRIMLYESPHFKHPDYGKQGRGLVWGFVNDLKSWKSLSDYERIAIPLPNNSSWPPTSVYWSPFAGEENILYGIYTRDKTISKLNVDTGVRTLIISYDPGDGRDIHLARCMGWTSDHHLIVNFSGESGAGYEIDVQNKIRNRFSSWPDRCSPDGRRFPHSLHGHTGRSPNGALRTNNYGFNGTKGVLDCVTGNFVPDKSWTDHITPPWPKSTAYVSWTASEKWYLASSGQDIQNIQPQYFTKPTIAVWSMWQVHFDGQNFIYREILTKKTAGAWDPDGDHKNGNEIHNYHSHFIPVLRADGRQIFFTTTEGKYSYEDYIKKKATPWEFNGFYLAELAPAGNGSDTESPTAPTNVQAAVKSENEITISWTASTDNLGVAGYRIYRDGNKIAEIATTTFTDNHLSPGTTYSFAISAVDFADNKSPLSETVSATTREIGQPALTILKTKTSPVIDGDISDFRGANEVSFQPLNGGNRAFVQAIWNSEALFIGYKIFDTQILADITLRDGTVWRDDAIEWFVDTHNNGGSSSTNGAYMLADDYHGIVNTLNTKYDSRGTQTGTPNETWDGSWESAVKLFSNNGGNEPYYTIEIKIPWSSIETNPVHISNKLIRMSFAVDDLDQDLTDFIMWPNITTNFENAANWSPVLISEKLIDDTDTTAPEAPKGLRVEINGE